MSKIEKREQELWSGEAVIAQRLARWFDMLRSLRSAAVAGVDPAELLEPIKGIDPEMLDHDFHWLMSMLTDRFKGEMDDLANLKQLAEARKRKCPYTAAEYDEAVKVAGTKQEPLAKQLGVTRKTLRKYGRPND